MLHLRRNTHRRSRPVWRLLLLGWLAACSPTSSSPPRRAVVILLDAARADRFSSYGYERETTPNMDRIAERGQVFERHFSTGVNTRSSMPALLYSRYYTKPVFPYSSSVSLYSPDDLFRVLDDEAISFPAALEQGGFHTAAISAHHWFHEDTEFAQEFTEFHDLASAQPRTDEQVYPTADVVIDAARRWLREVPQEEDSFLLYIHLMDTHFPHVFGPDAQEFFGASEYPAEGFAPTGELLGPGPAQGRDRDYIDALYDGSLRFADREIGRLIDDLEQRGWLDQTLFAITADHGEQLWHHRGRFLHGGSWVDAVAHVPMILSMPGKVPVGRTGHPTQGADVHPTLLSLLDVPLPEGKTTDGLNLLSPEIEQREWIYERRGARSERYKFLLDIDDTQLGRFFDNGEYAANAPVRVYDLQNDPEELDDLAPAQPELAARLRSEFRAAQRGKFDRYRTSVGDVPPRGSFAIESRDWATPEVEATLSLVPEMRRAEPALAESENGWLRSDVWGELWLRARGDADPLEVRVAVPSGEYEVKIEGNGRFDVELPERTRQVDLEPTPADWSGRWYKTKLGVTAVKDKTFRMVLKPGPDGAPFRVRRLGFRPTGARAELDDEDRTEALRALGYAE